MSKRRKAGDWVWLRPNTGFVSESDRLKAEIMSEEGYFDNDVGGTPCFQCDDPDCREWVELLTEPDPVTGKRYPLCHVSECEMFDEQQIEQEE